MAIELDPDTRARICAALAAYVREEFEEEIGDLRAQRLLDFVMELVGASAYNAAVADAHAWIQRKLLDLEADLHERVEYEPGG